MEGRVEMCGGDYAYNWGTICNKQWTSSHTKVICRNLGYDDNEGMSNVTHPCIVYIFIHMDG